MIDDPLPTPSGIDAERESSDGRPSGEGPSDPESNEAQPDAERPSGEPTAGPDRTVDPPPGAGADRESDNRGPEAMTGDDDSEGSEPLEHRLERLRLWRTVATLAVVVARLVRSL